MTSLAMTLNGLGTAPTIPTGDVTVLDSEHVRLVTEAVAPLDPDPLIGFVVAGRYRIRRLLGRGGMGVVYEVEHVEIGKILALKLLSGALSQNPEMVSRFKREATLASKLSGPHTVQVFDYGVSGGLTWLVMQRVEGQTLSRVLRDQGPMDAERVARIVIGVASSLAEAHAQGIVHRDIKPGNVMLTRSPTTGEQATVLDFGLATLRTSAHSELSARGMVVGTPSYMAPEQVRGEQVDGRTDIYALGAVMYRALTGRPLFAGASLTETCARQVRERPVPPHLLRPELGIPEALSRVVMRALEKKPELRYPSAEELRRAVLEAVGWDGGDDEPFRERLSENVAIPLVRREDTTRLEIERYERKLDRQRWLGRGLAVLVGLVALGLAFVLGMSVIRVG